VPAAILVYRLMPWISRDLNCRDYASYCSDAHIPGQLPNRHSRKSIKRAQKTDNFYFYISVVLGPPEERLTTRVVSNLIIFVEQATEAMRTGNGAGVKVAVLDSGIELSHPDTGNGKEYNLLGFGFGCPGSSVPLTFFPKSLS
jgi:subtilisin family serine protease